MVVTDSHFPSVKFTTVKQLKSTTNLVNNYISKAFISIFKEKTFTILIKNI